MHIFLRVLLWLNSHLITQYHLSFFYIFAQNTKSWNYNHTSSWKHHCINQYQQGKIQTQISKERKEKSNPVKSKYFLSATSSQEQQRKKSRGDKPAMYFLLEFYCLFPLHLEVFVTVGVHCRYPVDTWIPGYYSGAGSALTPTPEQLHQELCCSPSSAAWRVSMICPRLHKQSRTDM